VTYVEVDYYDVVEKKIHAIKKSESLAKHIWNTPEEINTHSPAYELNTPHYKLISGDLRETHALN